MSDASPWLSGFKSDYEAIFVESWSPYAGVLLVVLLVMALMLSGMAWGVFGGLKLWGDYFNQLIGLGSLLGISQTLDNPLIHRISLMNICLVLGAFSASLMAGQFVINRPPKLEYIWAITGGSLMGIGASLAGGCTVGGFFTPSLHSSPAGWMMMVGLTLGAIIGIKLLLWTFEHISWGMQAPASLDVGDKVRSFYPFAGLAIILLILVWAYEWYASEDKKLVTRALIVLVGFALGFVMHRSRICFARAIREPFMTAEGEMTKAIILALAIGSVLASLFFQKQLIDPYLAIPASFWIGSLLGGVLFGLGMVLAGGCASGSLWRMGEGHIKLWVAVFFFAWVGSISAALFRKTGLVAPQMNLDLIEVSQVGYQAYFPVMLDGWGWTYLITAIALLIWYVLVRYNESTDKFTLL